MARGYAEGTKVPLEQTQAEISNMLARLSCSQTMTMQNDKEFTVAFVLGGVAYKMSVPKPDETSKDYTHVKVNARASKAATPDQVQAKVRQEMARRMRALAALIKARLVAIDEGVTTMERAFIGDIVTGPNGQTVADMILPQIAKTLEAGGTVGTLALPFHE